MVVGAWPQLTVRQLDAAAEGYWKLHVRWIMHQAGLTFVSSRYSYHTLGIDVCSRYFIDTEWVVGGVSQKIHLHRQV